jgi:predicted RNA-binding Zn ribbon-like protein
MLHAENTDSMIDCSYNTRPNNGITMLLNLGNAWINIPIDISKKLCLKYYVMQQGSKQDHFHYPPDVSISIHETAGMKEIKSSVYQVTALQNVPRNVNKMKNQK